MKVYVIEYLKDKSFISSIISFVTNTKYSHSAMFINDTWCELDATNEYKGEPDYHTKYYTDICTFLKMNPDKKRTEAFLIPHDFPKQKCDLGIQWWKEREKQKKWYGYSKLTSFLWLTPLRPLMKLYYKAKGKPYNVKTSSDKNDVCSVAVDKCLKHMGYDIFPDMDERTTYPGLYAKKLSTYKVKC